jgi:glycosyltransferase involved in cell wall biosynthesis
MNILVHKNDFDLQKGSIENEQLFQLNSATSVNQLKLDYFSMLSKVGSLIQVSEEMSKEEWQSLCNRDDTLFASFHEEPLQGVGCRFLKHSLGSLMLVGGFLGGWEFRDVSCNMVTSQKQAKQLQKGLGSACPSLGVITPSIKTDLFRLPDSMDIKSERNKIGLKETDFHLIYAGRIIANKGLVQLVRALNLWPVEGARLSVVGSFEPDFFIYQSNAYHTTFPDFFRREAMQRSSNMKISQIPARPRNELKELYWSADCFVYPSFHEDENFGLAPREALLCGVPAVVSDFCGLGQLAGSKSTAIKTYPTLGGIRFSLNELRQKINEVRNWTEKERQLNRISNAEFALDECDQSKALISLKKSVTALLKKPPGDAPQGGWRAKDRIDRWAKIGPESFKKAIALKGTQPPEGLFVDGTGFTDNNAWFSDPHFLKAIQSFYTTLYQAPGVIQNRVYRGFWRIALWPEERALVEFGFPGPRVKRFDKKDWEALASSLGYAEMGEVVFSPVNEKAIPVIQELLELGYIVPDMF